MDLTMQKEGKTSMVKAQAYLKAGKIKKWVMAGGYCGQDSSVELELSVPSRATVMLPCERAACQIACETSDVSNDRTRGALMRFSTAFTP
jgi:hypothetical protein